MQLQLETSEVACKLMMFAQQVERKICTLSSSGGKCLMEIGGPGKAAGVGVSVFPYS